MLNLMASILFAFMVFSIQQGCTADSEPNGQSSQGSPTDAAVDIMPPDKVPMIENVRESLRFSATIHANSFLNAIQAFETLRCDLARSSDSASVESVDLVLRELRTLRSVATAEYVMVNRSNDHLVLMGIKTVEFIENGLVTGGLLLPSSGWQPGPTLGAELMPWDVWQLAKQQRIKTGRWAGAFQAKEGLIALAGLDCFKNYESSAGTRTLALLSRSTDEAILRQRVQDLDEIVHVLSQFVHEFDAIYRQIMGTQALRDSPYTNSVWKTQKMLVDLHSMYSETGGEIPPSVARGRFDFRNLYDPEYFRQLAKGLENYGYLDVTGSPMGLGKNFYVTSFPPNAKLVEYGDKAGFFELGDGDLVVPGLRFYREQIKTAKK
jgi:hypothetical protein